MVPGPALSGIVPLAAGVVDRGMVSWWAPVLAFLAGLISVVSPCVWPLLPGYVSFISGERIVEEDAGPPADRSRVRRLAPILLFIAGFTVVFTLMGAFAATFVRVFRGDAGQRIGGAIVILFGVLMIGYAVGRGSMALYAERRPFLARVRPGTVSAFPLGMAFAAGWTPCVGPVLGSILALAAAGGTPRAVMLLVVYSAGLGVPFLLVGLGVDRLLGAFGWIRRRYTAIAVVSGSLMIVLGLLLFTGRFTRFVAPLADRFRLSL